MSMKQNNDKAEKKLGKLEPVSNSDQISEIKKVPKFKKMIVKTGSDPSLRIDKLPFDNQFLDKLTNGGLPIGKQTLIYGESHVGKTFLLQMIFKAAQARDKKAIFIDADKGFEPEWWQAVGVDIDKLIVAQPNTGEQAFDLVHELMQQDYDLIAIDSLDLLVPTVELENTMEDQTMGLQARMNATGLRKSKKYNTKTVFICTNHVRNGMGRFAQMSLPGGKAQEEMSSVMLWVARGGAIKESEVTAGGDDKKKVGFKMRVTIEKDKINGALYEKTEIPFMYAGGTIDVVGGVVELLVENELIEHKGPYFTLYNGDKMLGKLNVKKYLAEHPDVLEEYKKKLAQQEV